MPAIDSRLGRRQYNTVGIGARIAGSVATNLSAELPVKVVFWAYFGPLSFPSGWPFPLKGCPRQKPRNHQGIDTLHQLTKDERLKEELIWQTKEGRHDDETTAVPLGTQNK